MSCDYRNQVGQFLAKHGIENWHIERRRRHRAVVVKHQGRVVTIMIPTSPSNRWGPQRALSDLRHALGLVGKQKVEQTQ
jgi:hypothetical protein